MKFQGRSVTTDKVVRHDALHKKNSGCVTTEGCASRRTIQKFKVRHDGTNRASRRKEVLNQVTEKTLLVRHDGQVVRHDGGKTEE